MADQIFWTSPGGTTVELTDSASGYSVLASGTTGLRSVKYEPVTTQYAGVDGASIELIRAEPNQPTLGLMLEASSESDFQTRARALVHLMRPQAGAGVLTVRTSTGDTRNLDCYCIGGLEGDESPEVTMTGAWWRLVLQFYAPSPWWTGDEQTIDFGLGAPSQFFPFFPLKLSASSVQGQFTVNMADADAPSYPMWTVTGPGSSLLLENQTTSRSIQVNAPLSLGQSMVIDTRPGQQSIRRSDGTNLMSYVTSDPALWPLVEGINYVSATLTGATAASRISGVYRPRYSGI